MAELTEELIAQLAIEEVVDIKTGVDYHNRVIMTTESGHVITADIMSIQTPQECIDEINSIIERKNAEVLTAVAEKEALVSRMAILAEATPEPTVPEEPLPEEPPL